MDREPHELEDREQIERLLRERAEIGERFVKQVDDLGATAEELALLEGALRAARRRASVATSSDRRAWSSWPRYSSAGSERPCAQRSPSSRAAPENRRQRCSVLLTSSV